MSLTFLELLEAQSNINTNIDSNIEIDSDVVETPQITESNSVNNVINAVSKNYDERLDNSLIVSSRYGLTTIAPKDKGRKVSAKEFLATPELDWQVSSSPVQYKFGAGLVAAEDHKVLHRSDSGEVLGVVGKDYKEVQNSEIIGFFENYASKIGAELTKVGYADGGRKVFAHATLESEIQLPGQELGSKHVMLLDSRDGSGGFQAMPFFERVYCFNQLPAANAKFGKISRRHTKNLDLRVLAKDLDIISQNFDDMIPKLQRMINTGMSRVEALRFIYSLHKKQNDVREEGTRTLNIVKSIWNKLYAGTGIALDTEGTRESAYGVLNAITEHYNHDTTDNSNNLWKSRNIGAGATMMTQAYNCLDEIISGTKAMPESDVVYEYILERTA